MCISYLTVARTRWSFARGEDPRQQPDGTDCAGAGAGFPRAGPGRGWRHVRHLLSYWKECQGRHYLTDRGVKALTVLLTGVSRQSLSYWQGCQCSHCLTDRGVKAVIVLLTGVSRPSLSFWQGCQGNHCLTDRDVKAVPVLLTGMSMQSLSYWQGCQGSYCLTDRDVKAVNVLLPLVTVSLAIYFDIFHLCYTFCYRYLCGYLLQLIDIYFDTRYLFGSNHYARYPFGYTLVVDVFFTYLCHCLS